MKKIGTFIEGLLVYLLASVFIGMGAVTKLVGASFQRETFEHFGYPLWMMYFVGVLELILGVMIVFRRFRFLGAVGMILVTLGVVFSLAKAGELGLGVLLSPPVLVMAAATFVAWRSHLGTGSRTNVRTGN